MYMQSTLQSTVNFVGIFVSFMYVLVKKYRTERAKKSSIPFMQTLLNKHYKQESQTYKSLVRSIFVDTCSSELQSESRLIADGL